MARKVRVFRNPFAIETKAIGDDFPTNVESSYPIQDTGQPPQAQFNKWNTDRAIQEGMKVSEWVYTCVSRIAAAAASVPWKIYQQQSDGTRKPYIVRGKQHPLEYLLANPNPWLNGGDWVELFTQHLYLGGNTINKVVMMGEVPVSIIPVMPDNVDVIPGSNALVDRYDIWKKRNAGQSPEKRKPAEVLHMKFTDPSNFYWGMAPLQAVARTVDTDVEAIKWNKLSLQNRAVADGVFVVNTAIDKKQYTELRQMIRDQHQGPKNAHTPWLLGYGVDWKQMSLTPQELDFILSRKMNRESILAVYNVPPPVAGLYEAATYNNLRTARMGFWLDTIIPYLDNVKAALQFYFQQFKAFGADFIIDYDLTGVEALKPTLEESVAAAKTLWQMGVPLNVLNNRFELNLPSDIQYSDVSFVAGVNTAENITKAITGQAVPHLPPPTPASNQGIVTFTLHDPTTLSGRDEQWAANDKHRQRYEQRITDIAGVRLQDDYQKIADGFAADGRVIDLDVSQWHKELLSVGVAVVLDAGTRMLDDIKKVASSNGIIEQWNDSTFDITTEVTNFLEDWVGIRAEEYTATTIDIIHRIIQTGQDEGLKAIDIAKRIKTAGEESGYRAVRIGSTEAVGLQNYSIIEAAKQSKVIETKTWVSSRDSRVRDTHRASDGQTVPIDEQFSVGGAKMDHPADYKSSAKESVHCRCTVALGLKTQDSSLTKVNKRTLSM